MEELIHNEGYVLVAVDVEEKNWHDLGNGQKLYMVRGVDNFNRRQTEPVQGQVISGDGLYPGDVILLHHNSIIEANEVTAIERTDGKKVFAIPTFQCYAIVTDEKITPLPGFFTAERIFKKPSGIIICDLEPIKNKLFVLEGTHKGKVVDTLVHSDYEIRFQWKGKEAGIIRARDTEVVGVDGPATKEVFSGVLLTGLNVVDANDKHAASKSKQYEPEEICAVERPSNGQSG